MKLSCAALAFFTSSCVTMKVEVFDLEAVGRATPWWVTVEAAEGASERNRALQHDVYTHLRAELEGVEGVDIAPNADAAHGEIRLLPSSESGVSGLRFTRVRVQLHDLVQRAARGAPDGPGDMRPSAPIIATATIQNSRHNGIRQRDSEFAIKVSRHLAEFLARPSDFVEQGPGSDAFPAAFESLFSREDAASEGSEAAESP